MERPEILDPFARDAAFEQQVVERGWAASEVRRYDRGAIGVPHDDTAIKEWDYYAILSPDFGLALTVADNGHMGFLGASWMDFRTGSFVNGGVGLPAPHGAMAETDCAATSAAPSAPRSKPPRRVRGPRPCSGT